MNLGIIKHYYFDPVTILDIGANIGQFVQEAKRHFPKSYIFSIEASEACEEQLKQVNPFYYIGLLSKDGKDYTFYSRKDTDTGTGNSIYRELTHFYSDENVKPIIKPSIRLDDLFTEDSSFDLIKIDTQGSELDIIQGGMNMVSKAKGVILEVSLLSYNYGAPLYLDVVEFMKKIGFEEVEVLDETSNHGSHQKDILFLNKKFKI